MVWKAALPAACIAVLWSVAVPAEELIRPDTFRVRLGDDPGWARPGLDDSGWEITRFEDAPRVAGPLWLRTRIELSPERARQASPLGVLFAGLAAHEIYWDGELIGRGGTVGGSAAEEVPGPLEAQYLVPGHLATIGEHTLAVRTSAFHRGYPFANPWWALAVGDYDRLLEARQTYAWVALSSLSAILVGGFFALILFLADRRDRAFLALAVLCFVAAALLVAESWRPLVGYTYDLHIVRLLVITVLSWLFNLVLAVFVAVRFPIRRRGWAVAATGLALLAPALLFAGWDSKAGGMFFVGFTVAALWSGRALLRRLPGALAATVGSGAALVTFCLAPTWFGQGTLFFAVGFLLLCLLAAHAVRVRRDRREREEALLRSARLEVELLRKHIQPHFLMNTLTALSEWIEEDPATATAMIGSLAEEFRLLSEISDRRMIPMRDELRSCRLHLELMSGRKGRRYELVTEGVDPETLVPPAVFHTLVENALTHGGAHAETTLVLRARRDGASIRYTFDAPSGAEPGTDSPIEGRPVEERPVEEKTGLRYVRARLRESFGGDWSLRHGPVQGLWRTEIAMPEVRA